MTKGQPLDTHINLTHEPEINKFFKAAIKVSASDLHLKVGMPPKLRVHSVLKSTTGEPLSDVDAEKLVVSKNDVVDSPCTHSVILFPCSDDRILCKEYCISLCSCLSSQEFPMK